MSQGNAREFPDDQRIRQCRSPVWIGYTAALRILSKLEQLFAYPKRHRMPNLLIVGETNNGKTALINRFQHLHPIRDDPDAPAIEVPVLLMEAPPVPDERRFCADILDRLGLLHRTNERADRMLFQIVASLPRLHVQMLIVDEIHNVLAGGLQKQRAFLNVVKYLGNTLQIPIVAVGTRDAFNAIQTDAQLANRFEPEPLPRWEYNRDYLRLLASFESLLPLRAESHLPHSATANRILGMSGGVLGEISAVIFAAAIEAIRSGGERITPEVLDHMNWVRPSERRRVASRLI